MGPLAKRQAERAEAKRIHLGLPVGTIFSGFTGLTSLAGIGYTAKVAHRGNGGLSGDESVAVEPDDSNANGRAVATYFKPVAPKRRIPAQRAKKRSADR